MNAKTAEEYRAWLIEQTEKCIKEASLTVDTKMMAAIDSAANDYISELKRLTANKKKADDIS